jgi:hypothetical protein
MCGQDYPEQPPSTVATASDLTPKGELEDRVPRGDASELRVRRCCAHTVEEDPHLHLPTLQIGAENVSLLIVDEFDGGERLNPLADPELTGRGHPEIPDPLRLAPGCDEIVTVIDGQ